MSRVYLIIFLILLIVVATTRILLYKPAKLPKSVPVKFEATIKREPRVYETYQVINAADSKVYADLYPRYRVGDRLKIEGQFDEQGRMFGGKVEKVGHLTSLASFRSSLRNKISENISRLLPEREATLIVGTVLGVDTISAQFRDELVKTGTIHVVVVSGQNLMLVAGIFLALGRYIGRRQSMVLATVAVFAYAFLTGFEPPVVRASIMVLVSSLAIFLGREADVIWTILVTALLMVILWPQALFEISFQLTFAATIGIVTLGQKLINFFSGPASSGSPTSQSVRYAQIPSSQGTPLAVTRISAVKYALVQNAAIATSAYLFTAPIIYFYFSRVSPIAPIANILVAEAVFPIMVLGFLIAFATLIFTPLAQILAYLAYVPAFYFSQIVRIFSQIPTPF